MWSGFLALERTLYRNFDPCWLLANPTIFPSCSVISQSGEGIPKFEFLRGFGFGDWPPVPPVVPLFLRSYEYSWSIAGCKYPVSCKPGGGCAKLAGLKIFGMDDCLWFLGTNEADYCFKGEKVGMLSHLQWSSNPCGYPESESELFSSFISSVRPKL